MSGRESTQSLLVLRKLTRAITEVVKAQVTEHLATLTPLLRPSTVFGDYIQGAPKEQTRKAEKAFKDLQALYESVATAKPFSLPRELTTPFNIGTDTLEITAQDYVHEAKAGSDGRKITVRSPLTWTLTYTGYGPTRFQELLDTKLRSNEAVLKFVLSYLLIHVVTTSQPGILHLLEALHLPLTTVRTPEFGNLPITRIGAAITTTRPADAVILESAEVTGMDAFEELVSIDEISRLQDPLREKLLAIAKQQAPELVSR
jgi:hypothetical protein